MVANATDTYLTGSALPISGHLKVGTVMKWVLAGTKTAAGTAVPSWNMRFGTGATVTDTARCTVTGSAQTAASDMGIFEVYGVFRSTGATSVVQAHWDMRHSGTTAGMMNVTQGLQRQVLSTSFDVTPASTQVGLSVNPGTSGVWTFHLVSASLENYV